MPLIIWNCNLRSLFVVWLIVMYLIVVVVVRHCLCSPSLVSSLLSLFVFVGSMLSFVVSRRLYVVVRCWLPSSSLVVVGMSSFVVHCHRRCSSSSSVVIRCSECFKTSIFSVNSRLLSMCCSNISLNAKLDDSDLVSIPIVRLFLPMDCPESK